MKAPFNLFNHENNEKLSKNLEQPAK